MRLNITLFLSALLLAGCGAVADDPVTDADSPRPAGPSASTEAVLVIAEGTRGGGDGGMSVSEALAHRATDDIVFVMGALFVDADGSVRLCEAIAESFPPQCGGARLLVEGLDLDSVANLQTEGAVSWAENVTLPGSVE